MPFTPVVKVKTPVSDKSTPFNETLAVAGTAQDLVLVPVGRKGRAISLVNEGPGDIAIVEDATATVTSTLVRDGEAYAEFGLEVATKFSFINVTPSATPVVRGVLWSGPPVA